jgi:predicted 2-oxoglutarate/Fe(II)-dependent dioxygenase YbiX
MKLTKYTDLIWTIDDFLSKEECDELIYSSEVAGYEEAKVSLSSGAQMMKGLRNNDRLMYKDDALASRLWEKLKSYCPESIDNAVAVGLNEMFRFYRYEEGQRFKRHIDGRFKKDENTESRITFMVYLNEGYEGGETTFDNVRISAKTGKALCFIHEQKHESIPLASGIKYVLRSDVMYWSSPEIG